MNQLFGLQHRRDTHPQQTSPFIWGSLTAPSRRSFTKVRLGIKALAFFYCDYA